MAALVLYPLLSSHFRLVNIPSCTAQKSTLHNHEISNLQSKFVADFSEMIKHSIGVSPSHRKGLVVALGHFFWLLTEEKFFKVCKCLCYPLLKNARFFPLIEYCAQFSRIWKSFFFLSKIMGKAEGVKQKF